MKFNWCRKILKEETVEMKDTVFGTIEKLRLSNEMVQNKGKSNSVFFCNEKGLFSIIKSRNTMLKSKGYYYQYLGELCYLKGKVFQQSQKAYIKYQIVYNPLIRHSISFIVFIYFLVCGLYVYNITQNITIGLVYGFFLLLYPSLVIYFIIKFHKKPKTVEGLGLTKMEEELLWRIDAINNWEK